MYLAPGLGSMKLPVIVYAIVIHGMLAAALNRRLKVNRQSYWLVFSGAALFILSDSMIALNRFSFSFNMARIFIMSTYVLAQYLIAVGCLKQFDPGLK